MISKHLLLAILILSAALSTQADEVRTSDGSILQGNITALNAATLTLETPLFGALNIPRTEIIYLTMDQPASLRLHDDSTRTGFIGTENTRLDSDSAMTLLSQVQDLWLQRAEDPRILARQAELATKKRKWKTDVFLAANGKSGNTTEQKISASIRATLSSPRDELKLYALYTRKSSEGVKSSDERIAGARYSSYVLDPLGWYVRTEFESDAFENIDLRATVAGGLSYRWFNKAHYKLSTRAGTSYRQERYSDGTDNQSFMGLDFGLSHFYRFKNRWEIQNELTLLPSAMELSNYIFTQDSNLAIPLADSEFWKLRVGLRNDYNSQPADERGNLDSTFYSALSIRYE